MLCIPLHQTWQIYPLQACWCHIDMRNTECPFDTRNTQIVLYRPSTVSVFPPFWHSLSLSLMQLTVYMQLKHSFMIIIIFRCCNFATNSLHTVKMIIWYHCHLLLSSICNWLSSGVCVVYNIPSVGVKGTSSVPWSSANFCSISQNMHYKVPVPAEHWKTNKVGCTWKDDWHPWRTSTYERPFTQEGNHIVSIVKAHICQSSGRSTEMRCSIWKTFYP